MSGFLRISTTEREAYTLLRVYRPGGDYRVLDDNNYWPVVNASKGLVISGNGGLIEIVNLTLHYETACKWIAVDKGVKGYLCLYSNVTKHMPYDIVPR